MGQRLFFALDIDEATRQRIGAATSSLRSLPGRIKWTEPKNLHVTISFLGDVPDKRVASLCDLAGKAVDSWDRQCDAVDFTLGPLICFPDSGRARMIWAPVTQGIEAMTSLHGALNQALAEGQWPTEDRPFNGHVTVGRIKEGDFRQAVKALPSDDLGQVSAGQLVLYESHLKRTGPIYTCIERIPLARKP